MSQFKFLLLIPFKVPISWLGILHNYNIIWNPVIRIAISCRSKILSSWTFRLLKLTEVTSNQESVLQ